MKSKNLITGYMVAILVVFSTGSLSAQDLVILHTNDVHSNIEPVSSGKYAGLGGFQRRANYIKSIRDNHANVLLLDAGDYNQGTPYYTMFEGEVEMLLYNAMGYDVVALGNHEFDDGQEALAKRLRGADYVTVCANYDFSETPLDTLVKPYTIIEKGGRRIGIIGLLIDLKGYVSQKSREGIEYKDPVKVANRLAKRLKRYEKCDLVILLTHIGYDGGTKKRASDLDLAEKTKNVDLIIGGHSHTFLEKPAIVKNRSGKDVIVNQTGALGVYVGRIDVTFN